MKRAVLLIALALAGCAQPSPPRVITSVRVERLTIPPSLLTCQAAPVVPQVNVTQRAVAVYIVRLWASRMDCASKLAAIKRIQDQTKP